MIKCNDINITDTYIGSTSNFKNRIKGHKSHYNNINIRSYNYKLYKFIRDNGGFENFQMIKLEEFICDSKEEKLIKERYYIELYKCSLNSRSSYQTTEEIKEYKRKWYEDNREKFIEKQRKNYENNKEKINIKKRELYKNNKEKINEKITCDCGCIVSKSNLSRHKKSKKHIDYLINKSNQKP